MRERLLLRSTGLRDQVAVQSAVMMPALDGIDHARDVLRWLRAHPALVVSGIVAVAVARPRFVWRWSLRAFSAWQFVRRWRRRLEGWVPS